MIHGIDLGNVESKHSNGNTFPSKLSLKPNILGTEHSITFGQSTYYIGEGNYDTEYRKAQKEFLHLLFLYAVGKNTNELSNKVVVGLPISQHKLDKEVLRQRLLQYRTNELKIDGTLKKFNIDDIAVYPEGLGAIVGENFEGVVCDIGGRTTEACEAYLNDQGLIHIEKPISIPQGILNLYTDFIDVLNSTYGLDLKYTEAPRIIKNSLTVDGIPKDITPAMALFKDFVDDLVGKLRMNYSISTKPVLLVGGGSVLLSKPIIKRVPNAFLHKAPVRANADGFKRWGELIWR